MAVELKTVILKVDQSFDEKETQRYDLFFETGDKVFAFSLRDTATRRFVFLGCYRNTLAETVHALPWLSGVFHTVSGFLGTSRFTLIPDALFDEGLKERYLGFVQDQDPGENIGADRIEALNLYTVYGIPSHTAKEVQTFFPKATLNHISGVLIRSLWLKIKNRSGAKVFLNMREDQFDLLVFEDNQLKYCNSFHFRTPEDIGYFVIFVFEQLGLNPEEIAVELLGNIDRFSPVYDLLLRYIRNLGWASRNEGHGYSYVFDDLPPQFCYTLLNPVS
jgi:hypothetical protein